MSSQKPRDEGEAVTGKDAGAPDPDQPTQPLDTLPWTGPEAQSLVGRTLAQYRITEHLGQGGMGVVYKAEDTRLNRPVALKFLPPQLLTDTQAKQRFLREARAAAALDDPHICTVHDIAEVEGHTFIVMNYVEGGSLKDRMSKNPPSVAEALEITAQIGRGLSKAHAQGIIHRDIKPANILLTRDGQVKIADFGLAKLAHQTRLTRTGAVVGTLAYMSPEQTRGQEVDGRADIWSLGVVLYEMLTGELPFRGSNERAMARSILKKSPKPVSDFRPEVSLELEDLVEKSLSKRPGKRYPEVDAFLADVQEQIRVLDQGRKPGRWVTLERFFRRRSTRRAVAATVLAMVAGAALYVVPRVIPPRDVPRIMVAKWENKTGRDNLDWVSGALMSGLIQTLGDVEGYNVISRQTVATTVNVLQTAAMTPPIPLSTAREVKASYLVSGTFEQEGDQFVINYELTDVANEGVVVDNGSFLADSTHIQEAVVDVAVKVAEALHASWTQDPRTSSTPQPTASTAALRHYQRALAAEERNEYGEALDELFQAVKHDSTFAEAHFKIAWITRDRDVEQKHYTLAMKYRLLTPPLTRKLIEAQGLSWDGKVDPAIKMYEEILREDPEQVTARKELAWLYSNKGDFNQSLAEYAVLHEISPLDFSFYRDWAMAYVRIERPDDAIDLIKSWRARFPGETEPLSAFLVLCHRLARYREGVALCDSIAAGDPDGQPYACGWLLEGVGRLKDAEHIFLDLVNSPDAQVPSSQGYAYLAWLADRRQTYTQGLQYIDKALAHQDGTWYRWLAGSLAAGAGQLDRAREEVDAIVRLNPGITDTTVSEAVGNRRWYYSLQGRISLAEGHPHEASTWFERALRYTSPVDDATFRTYLGQAYLEAGNLDGAVRELETVRAARPSFPQALLYLGKAYLLKDDRERSQRVLRSLREMWERADPEDPLNLELKQLLERASARG